MLLQRIKKNLLKGKLYVIYHLIEGLQCFFQQFLLIITHSLSRNEMLDKSQNQEPKATNL